MSLSRTCGPVRVAAEACHLREALLCGSQPEHKHFNRKQCNTHKPCTIISSYRAYCSPAARSSHLCRGCMARRIAVWMKLLLNYWAGTIRPLLLSRLSAADLHPSKHTHTPTPAAMGFYPPNSSFHAILSPERYYFAGIETCGTKPSSSIINTAAPPGLSHRRLPPVRTLRL